MDQDIPDDISFLMESPTSVRLFLRHTAFEFWKQRFNVVIVPTAFEFWDTVMTTFVNELAGSRGFSLIPPDGLGMVVSVNPRLLLPSKSVLAYARKQS